MASVKSTLDSSVDAIVIAQVFFSDSINPVFPSDLP